MLQRGPAAPAARQAALASPPKALVDALTPRRRRRAAADAAAAASRAAISSRRAGAAGGVSPRDRKRKHVEDHAPPGNPDKAFKASSTSETAGLRERLLESARKKQRKDLAIKESNLVRTVQADVDVVRIQLEDGNHRAARARVAALARDLPDAMSTTHFWRAVLDVESAAGSELDADAALARTARALLLARDHLPHTSEARGFLAMEERVLLEHVAAPASGGVLDFLRPVHSTASPLRSSAQHRLSFGSSSSGRAGDSVLDSSASSEDKTKARRHEPQDAVQAEADGHIARDDEDDDDEVVNAPSPAVDEYEAFAQDGENEAAALNLTPSKTRRASGGRMSLLRSGPAARIPTPQKSARESARDGAEDDDASPPPLRPRKEVLSSAAATSAGGGTVVVLASVGRDTRKRATPVRRSTRNMRSSPSGGAIRGTPAREVLESTGFAYKPNDYLDRLV